MTLRPKHAAKLALVVPVLTALAGCGLFDGGRQADRGPYAFTTETVAPEAGMLVLPNELVAERLAVRRDQSVNGWVTETVVLANNTAKPRENTLAIRARHGGIGLQRFFRSNAVQPMDAATLDARVGAEFAGASAVTGLGERRNRLGPYNFVVARYDDGVECVLAWQIVNAQRSPTQILGKYAMEYRVCDRERDPTRMLDLYDQVAVAPYL
jgi:Cellulose biosynthesis protein BcsN